MCVCPVAGRGAAGWEEPGGAADGAAAPADSQGDLQAAQDTHQQGTAGCSVFQVWIILPISSVADPDHRIHMFLGLLDPDPDPALDPDPSITK